MALSLDLRPGEKDLSGGPFTKSISTKWAVTTLMVEKVQKDCLLHSNNMDEGPAEGSYKA